MDSEEFAASKNDPILGQLVAGRFRVIERIGTGGMGTVYRADQTGLSRPVALKVLKKELVSDRDTVARFHREAKAMSMLMHPNTVRVFDFGEDEDEHLFLAMELLEGELLTAWIEREGDPPVDEAIEVIREILGSLSEAHSKGIIHRDLKPDNIFLARVEGQAHPVVKVLDFGIAKVFRDDRKIDQLETQAGTVFGTPRYMSPEQAQGKTLDHRSDLYSVGVLLYQLLTGRPPFLDDDAVVVMAKHIRETPVTPRRLVPDRPIPRSLERVLHRALAKEPEDRFGSADQFEAQLAACLPDVHREARRRAGASTGWLGSLPRVPLAIGTGLVTAATVFAVALVATSGPEEIAEARDVAAAHGPEPRPERSGRAEAAAVEPDPQEPTRTSVTLRSAPGGAEIWRGDQRLGTTPHVFDLTEDEALALTLRLDGHRSQQLDLSAASGPIHQVALEPERSRARPPASQPGRRSARRPSAAGAEPAEPAAPEPAPSTAAPSAVGPYERWD